ncbi:MAG: hypothetical protein ACWGOX_09650 [Desulforhopalus sp.]
MQRKSLTVVLAIVLVVAAVLYLLPNDKKIIIKQLDFLAESCSSRQGETAFELLKKAAAVAQLCADPCSVQVESLKIDGRLSRPEVRDHVLAMKKRLPGTIFSFHDTSVDVSGENIATIVTTLKLEGESVSGRFVDAYEIDITMEKDQGKWLFSSFVVVEFVNK